MAFVLFALNRSISSSTASALWSFLDPAYEVPLSPNYVLCVCVCVVNSEFGLNWNFMATQRAMSFLDSYQKEGPIQFFKKSGKWKALWCSLALT